MNGLNHREEMESLILAVSLVTLGVALGEYVFYNLVVAFAGLLRVPKRSFDFTPPVTVVIPAYDEEQHLRRKLENVLALEYPRELMEIIVVDDGSTDRTSEVAREFEDKGVKLIRSEERRGKIFVQKMAFSEANTEIVCITDATVLTQADALRKLAAHMADPQVGAVSACIRVRNRDANYLTRVAQFLFDIQNAQKLGESMLDSAAGLFGQFSLVRREAVGDFSTDVIYEDREFGIALRKRGFRARLEPGAAAGYHAPETLADFSRQKQRNIGAMTQSLVRHRNLLFNPRYGWYGLLIFPEYSLFRMLRIYLLAVSFVAALMYIALVGPASGAALLCSMTVAVFVAYIVGTALLAPLVAEPARFLLDIFAAIPAMALVAFHLGTAVIRYFRGDFTALWERVKRQRTV
ncbi:MAG: glycosyltransferase family 2 protein [Candidatus Abyssubacteria bacterium]